VPLRPLIAAAALLLLVGCSPSLPPDLQEYIAEIQERGMSEEAQSALRQLAGIETGARTVQVHRSSAGGGWGTKYTSSMCTIPGADPEKLQEIQRVVAEEVDRVVQRLRPVADADGSGFVSSAEGTELANAMMLGLRAAGILAYEDQTPETTAAALQLSPEELEDAIDRYNELISETGLSSAAFAPVPREEASDEPDA
jgi:hypothetical protein